LILGLDPPVSTSQVARITGVRHYTQLTWGLKRSEKEFQGFKIPVFPENSMEVYHKTPMKPQINTAQLHIAREGEGEFVIFKLINMVTFQGSNQSLYKFNKNPIIQSTAGYSIRQWPPLDLHGHFYILLCHQSSVAAQGPGTQGSSTWSPERRHKTVGVSTL
jgi:hypothetical protein